MQNTFTVTGYGLKVDKVMIKPGSELILDRQPPGHWSRFGEAGTGEAKVLDVATPAAALEALPPEAHRALAIRKVVVGLDPAKDFTQDGKPQVDVINERLNPAFAPVTAEERDAAMEEAQAAG